MITKKEKKAKKRRKEIVKKQNIKKNKNDMDETTKKVLQAVYQKYLKNLKAEIKNEINEDITDESLQKVLSVLESNGHQFPFCK